MNSTQTTNHAKLLLGAGAALIALLNSAALGTPAVIETAVNPANNHAYYLLENSNWTDAENAAIGLGGHLATINDLAENNWIWDRWGTNRSLWIGLYDPITGDGGGAQHAANFVWASGDSSVYRNWLQGEPNGDRYTYIYAKNIGFGGKWNDIANVTSDGAASFYGVVEVDICSPHRATGTATLFNGILVGVTLTDGGCGYTNAPAVLIQGGGGNGATATATMMDGRVIQINITSGGCCYTNLPEIVISSPPLVPTVSISVSRVKVAQNNLVPGWKYLLESSHDLTDWSPTGPEFTAQSETIVNEFDVDVTGRFFRLKVVP